MGRKTVQIVIVGCLAMLCLMGISSCVKCADEETEHSPRTATKKDFLKHNRNLFWSDSVCIVRYSDSLKLNRKPTPTNLWLTVHRQGEGKKIETGQRVTYEYVVQDLLGDTLYDYRKDGLRSINVGRSEDCIGIDEAMLQLSVGTQATVIIIPEKGFGIKGDDNNIFGRTILRYDINIIE